MLVSRLLRSLLRFLSPGIVPDGGGGAPDPAPAAEPPAPAPAPEAPAPAPAAEAAAASPAPAPAASSPADPFAALDKALDAVSTKAATPPEPTPAPTPAPTPSSAPAAKKDEFDYTPPEGMADRAKERWTSLTERAKLVQPLTERATQAETSLNAVRQMVTEAGVSAEEFSDLMQTARLVKGTTPQELQQALQRLDGIRADIAGRLGVEVPGIDLLATHADLKAEVESMALTKERALEIARLRGKGQQADQFTASEREQSQFKQTVDKAAASMEATLKTREGQPGHMEKLHYIATVFKDPARLQRFVTTYKPEQWEGALLDIYDAYTPPATAPAAPAAPQPLRSTNIRSGAPSRSGPVTAESAVESAFARMGL